MNNGDNEAPTRRERAHGARPTAPQTPHPPTSPLPLRCAPKRAHSAQKRQEGAKGSPLLKAKKLSFKLPARKIYFGKSFSEKTWPQSEILISRPGPGDWSSFQEPGLGPGQDLTDFLEKIIIKTEHSGILNSRKKHKTTAPSPE